MMGFLGDISSAVFGGGDVKDDYNPYDVDSESMQYGSAGGGSVRQGFYDDKAAGAQQRGGPRADYANADEMRRYGLESRADMYGATQMLADRANGGGYSAAQVQLQSGRDDNMRAQMAMAASGRAGNIAQAMRSGQMAAADQSARTNAQAAALRAQEQQQYTGMYMQALAQQRAMDLQAQGVDAQQAQYQAMLEMQQRQLNDQYSLGLYGLGEGAMQSQMQGAAAAQGLLGQQYLGVAGLNQQGQIANSQAQSAANSAMIGAAAGAATGGIGLLAPKGPKP